MIEGPLNYQKFKYCRNFEAHNLVGSSGESQCVVMTNESLLSYLWPIYHFSSQSELPLLFSLSLFLFFFLSFYLSFTGI